MARITVEDCIDKFESRFELVLVASNRARKLHSGENPTIEKDNDKNTVIALREIADETIPISEMKESLIQEYQTVSFQNDEDLSLDYINSSDENQNNNENIEKNDQEIDAMTDNNNENIEKNDQEIDAMSDNNNEDNYHEDVSNDNIKENPEDSTN